MLQNRRTTDRHLHGRVYMEKIELLQQSFMSIASAIYQFKSYKKENCLRIVVIDQRIIAGIAISIASIVQVALHKDRRCIPGDLGRIAHNPDGLHTHDHVKDVVTMDHPDTSRNVRKNSIFQKSSALTQDCSPSIARHASPERYTSVPRLHHPHWYTCIAG